MANLVLGAEAGYLLAGKVRFIVGDDGVGGPEATHYVLPKKLDNLLPGDFREWHCLDPFGEIVSGYQQELQLRLRSGEWSTYVQPPFA